jgi:hypothetical protein
MFHSTPIVPFSILVVGPWPAALLFAASSEWFLLLLRAHTTTLRRVRRQLRRVASNLYHQSPHQSASDMTPSAGRF